LFRLQCLLVQSAEGADLTGGPLTASPVAVDATAAGDPDGTASKVARNLVHDRGKWVIVDTGAVGDSSVERIRVRFELERDEEDWPPADSEYVWAVLLSPEVARIDSIPFFVPEMAFEDLVSVRMLPEGDAAFVESLKWSGNCTLRIIPLADDSEAGINDVLEKIAGSGIEVEVLGQLGIIAVNARPTADLVRLKKILDRGDKKEWWTYEEACVGGRWPE
jgi:hypothetical protein